MNRCIQSSLLLLSLVSIALAGGTKPVLVETGSVFDYPKTDPYDLTNLYGFNHAPSITRLADGRLLSAWFSGPYEGSVHQLIFGCYSSDDGRAWDAGAVLNDQPRKSDFDPAFISDGGRTWLFYSAGRWNRYPFVGGRDKEKLEVGIDSYQLFARYTDDSGRTWSEEKRIGEQTGSGSRSNGIKLSSGDLVLPMHRFDSKAPAIMKSADGGVTWNYILGPTVPDGAFAAEPTIAECGSGKLLMLVRSRDGWMWSSESTDRGESWSPLLQSDLPAAASSHSLLRVSDGRLILTHNPSKPPLRTPLTVRVSNDEGKTWNEPLEIDRVEVPAEGDEVYSRQAAYPSAVEMADGTVMIVWTRISVSPTEQFGKIRWARVKFE